MTTNVWVDPRAWLVQQQTGKTARQLLAIARRAGWQRRKIYGRWHISATEFHAWENSRTPKEKADILK